MRVPNATGEIGRSLSSLSAEARSKEPRSIRRVKTKITFSPVEINITYIGNKLQLVRKGDDNTSRHSPLAVDETLYMQPPVR